MGAPFELAQWQRDYLAAALRGFAQPQDRGAGDTIERLLTFWGMGPIVGLLKRWGLDCGCEGRRDALNAQIPWGWWQR